MTRRLAQDADDPRVRAQPRDLRGGGARPQVGGRCLAGDLLRALPARTSARYCSSVVGSPPAPPNRERRSVARKCGSFSSGMKICGCCVSIAYIAVVPLLWCPARKKSGVRCAAGPVTRRASPSRCTGPADIGPKLPSAAGPPGALGGFAEAKGRKVCCRSRSTESARPGRVPGARAPAGAASERSEHRADRVAAVRRRPVAAGRCADGGRARRPAPQRADRDAALGARRRRRRASDAQRRGACRGGSEGLGAGRARRIG